MEENPRPTASSTPFPSSASPKPAKSDGFKHASESFKHDDASELSIPPDRPLGSSRLSTETSTSAVISTPPKSQSTTIITPSRPSQPAFDFNFATPFRDEAKIWQSLETPKQSTNTRDLLFEGVDVLVSGEMWATPSWRRRGAKAGKRTSFLSRTRVDTVAMVSDDDSDGPHHEQAARILVDTAPSPVKTASKSSTPLAAIFNTQSSSSTLTTSAGQYLPRPQASSSPPTSPPLRTPPPFCPDDQGSIQWGLGDRSMGDIWQMTLRENREGVLAGVRLGVEMARRSGYISEGAARSTVPGSG